MLHRNFILFSFFSILFLNDCVLSVKVHGVYLLPPTDRKTKTCLDCDYELDTSDTLNAINWYRNDEMFYSFFASDFNPLKYVHKKYDDFRIVRRSSNQGTLCMKNILPSAAGYYKCEVTTKGTKFESSSAEEFLGVLMPNKNSSKTHS